MSQKTGIRCAICGRELTNRISIARGIGPVCKDKLKIDTTLQNEFKIELKTLGLPCYLYTECRFCPYNIHRTCPRERIILQKDLKGKTERICSFCGKTIINGSVAYKSGAKRIFECSECSEKNKTWRK